jgi:hypothetical protein
VFCLKYLPEAAESAIKMMVLISPNARQVFSDLAGFFMCFLIFWYRIQQPARR